MQLQHPHILTMAVDVKSDSNNKACPECIVKSSSQFFFKDNLLKEDGAIIDGVSPQRWLRLTHIESFDSSSQSVKEKEQEEKDAKAGTVADEGSGENDKGGEIDDRYL